jgi:ATP-binding cassette, subfamily B, bacterial
MKDNTKKTLMIYARKAWKYKFTFLASHTAIALAVIVNLFVPLYFKDLLDLVSAPGIDHEQLVPAVWHIIRMIILLEIISWSLWRTVDFSTSYFQSHVIADLSNDCFEYLHKHSHGFFVNNFGGALLKRVKWFTAAFENVADKILWNFIPLIVAITFITITLCRINFWLGGLVFGWVMIFLAINFTFTKYKLQYDLKRSEAETASTSLLADTITNHSNVKLFNGYFGEVKNFFQATDSLRRARYLTWIIGGTFFAVQGILWIGLEIGMYAFVIYLWRKGAVSTGVFALIQLYILNIFGRVWDFGKNLQRLYENLADAEEMTIIFNTPHEVKDIARAKELVVTQGEIEFKEVDFNYKSTRSILKNFNLRIAPRENVALIGPSGAGKTTIVKILFRMHDIAAGKVLIDGQNIARVTQESLWQNVSLVPQDPILFHRSLLENIRYGRPSASDEQVMEAAKLARCHDFILKTSDGYDTLVGERGIKLSGGERQRVAIARAILKNAPILVLDEATSSLDSRSENLIQEALTELMKNKTVIVIAHRLSTIRKMDRIIVIEKGKITEIGNHQSLLDNPDGTYNKLWELQAGGFNKR